MADSQPGQEDQERGNIEAAEGGGRREMEVDKIDRQENKHPKEENPVTPWED